jgi:F0F1-type ATP synthase assembly protein I
VSDDQTPGGPDSRRFLGDVLTFGWVLPAAIAAGAGLGYLADRVLGVFPVLTATFGVLGFAAGLRQIYRESGTIAGGGKGPRE